MPEHRLQRTREAYRENRVRSMLRDVDEMLRDVPVKTPWRMTSEAQHGRREPWMDAAPAVTMTVEELRAKYVDPLYAPKARP